MKTTKKILSLLGLTYTLAWHSPGLTAPRGLTLLYAYLRWCFAEISFEKLYPQELEKPRPNALATNHFRFDENAMIIIFENIHFWMDCRLKGTTPWQPSCQICVWSIVNLFSWIIVVIAKMWLLNGLSPILNFFWSLLSPSPPSPLPSPSSSSYSSSLYAALATSGIGSGGLFILLPSNTHLDYMSSGQVYAK